MCARLKFTERSYILKKFKDEQEEEEVFANKTYSIIKYIKFYQIWLTNNTKFIPRYIIINYQWSRVAH